MELHKPLPTNARILGCLIFASLCIYTHSCEFIDVTTLLCSKCCLSADTLYLWLSQYFYPLFHNDYWALREYNTDVQLELSTTQSLTLYTIYGKKQAPLMQLRDLSTSDNNLASLLICPLAEQQYLSSPLAPMTYPATNFWFI